jgi:hypothetical protein
MDDLKKDVKKAELNSSFSKNTYFVSANESLQDKVPTKVINNHLRKGPNIYIYKY